MGETNRRLFRDDTPEEGAFVAKKRRRSAFRAERRAKEAARPQGGRPFCHNEGRVRKANLFTVEVMKPNSVKITNIRAHFGVKCLDTRVTAIRQEK
jgi:hypothetical protein